MNINIMKRFDELLTSPWALWGISLAAAVFMWFYVMDAGEIASERRKFLCRIEYRNLESQLGVKTSVQETVIEIEAPENVLANVKYDAILCEVDLRGRTAGKYRETIKVTAPRNVDVTSVTPSDVDVELIRQVSRVFPVEVALPQNIPAGKYLEAVEIVPKELHVTGSERDLAKIGTVGIEPTVDELVAGKELLLPIKVAQSQPFEDEVTLEPHQIRMNATLVTGLPRKKVPVNVRLNGKPFMDYAVRSVTTDPAEVMVQGESDKLSLVSAADTETVDITGLSADQTLVVPLRALETSGDVSVMGANSVRLSIQLEPILAQKQLSGVPVAVEGQEQGKWTVLPSAVDVTLEASPSRIETLDPGESGLKVFVDTSNIFLSKAVLPVRFSLASGDSFKVVKTEPSTVTVSTGE